MEQSNRFRIEFHLMESLCGIWCENKLNQGGRVQGRLKVPIHLNSLKLNDNLMLELTEFTSKGFYKIKYTYNALRLGEKLNANLFIYFLVITYICSLFFNINRLIFLSMLKLDKAFVSSLWTRAADISGHYLNTLLDSYYA